MQSVGSAFTNHTAGSRQPRNSGTVCSCVLAQLVSVVFLYSRVVSKESTFGAIQSVPTKKNQLSVACNLSWWLQRHTIGVWQPFLCACLLHVNILRTTGLPGKLDAVLTPL